MCVTYVYMYVCMYICMYVCMYICMCVCVHMHACMYVCMYVCLHVCMYICMMYVCMYVHMNICTYRMRHKHLTVFDIRKPACQLRAAFILTVIMHNDVWSLVEMERWSVQHRTAAVDCLSKQSVTATQHGFRQQFQRHDAPSHNTLLWWVSKWRQEGSVKDSEPPGRPLSAHTPDNVQWVRDTVL